MINRKKWLNNLAIQDFSRDRKVAWNNLATPKLDWETFKRLANQFGIEQAKVKAQKIVDKTNKVN